MHHAERVVQAVIGWLPGSGGSASSRAQASAARMSSTVSTSVERTSWRGHDLLDRGDDLGEAAAAPRGTRRRTPRWRRCRQPGRCRRGPGRPGQRHRRETPRRRAGRTPRSPADVQSTGGAASGTRSGQARPSAMGIIMVGGLACTSVEPSTNSTIECTTLVGWTTTSMRSNGIPNNRLASITSSPLLTKVAELMVMTGPMFQVGCSNASATVTLTELARDCGPGTDHRWRSAPAVVPPPRVPPRRHCASALCSESTGTIWPGLRAVEDQRAAHDQGLLVGQREGGAGVERGQGRTQPDRPGDPVEDDVAGHRRGLGRGLLSERRGTPARTPPPAARTARGWTRRRSARPPGTDRGCAAPGRGPGSRWSPLIRAPRCRARSPAHSRSRPATAGRSGRPRLPAGAGRPHWPGPPAPAGRRRRRSSPQATWRRRRWRPWPR